MAQGFDRDRADEGRATEDRVRKLEEIAIRLDERAKHWDAGLSRLALLETATGHLKMAIGELRIKSGLVIVALGGVGAAVGSIVTALVLKSLG